MPHMVTHLTKGISYHRGQGQHTLWQNDSTATNNFSERVDMHPSRTSPHLGAAGRGDDFGVNDHEMCLD
jgi:hypothetical protein